MALTYLYLTSCHSTTPFHLLGSIKSNIIVTFCTHLMFDSDKCWVSLENNSSPSTPINFSRRCQIILVVIPSTLCRMGSLINTTSYYNRVWAQICKLLRASYEANIFGCPETKLGPDPTSAKVNGNSTIDFNGLQIRASNHHHCFSFIEYVKENPL